MEQLRKALECYISVSDQEWEYMAGMALIENVASNSILVREGAITSKMYFILNGIMRTYYIENGKEMNTYFACDNQFITSYTSFISQVPSIEYLETLEDSQLLSISKDALDELYRNFQPLERIGRIMTEKKYLCLFDRTIGMQSKTAKERYVDFIKATDKKIVQRVPQYHIASYLGMASESLSRIRKELVIS